MSDKEVKINCPENIDQAIIVDNQSGHCLVHCQAWMNFVLSGGCRFDGCLFLHPHSIRRCPFSKNNQVVGPGYVRPEKYQPTFLNG